MTQRNLELRAELRVLALVCDVLRRHAAGEDLIAVTTGLGATLALSSCDIG